MGIASKGAYQTLGDSVNGAAFIAKFNSSGSLLWATYYGDSDYGEGFIIDKFQDIYFTGFTNSKYGVATKGAYQASNNGNRDAYLAKFNSSGNLIWATYFGGSGDDQGGSLVLDTFGNVYLSGITQSITNISTTGAYQTKGDSVNPDVFLAKFNSSGSLLWATYYGGAGDDEGGVGAIDLSGNLYLSGLTNSSSGIATSGAYQTSLAGGFDAFLAKFSTSGSLLWSTYYGGDGDDFGVGNIVDKYGNMYLSGTTNSLYGIATTGAYQTFFTGGSNPLSNDIFLTKFDSNGNRIWATYYGGDGDNENGSLSIDSLGNLFLGGATNSSSGIATPGAYQNYNAGGYDVFTAKFNSSGSLFWSTYFGRQLSKSEI